MPAAPKPSPAARPAPVSARGAVDLSTYRAAAPTGAVPPSAGPGATGTSADRPPAGAYSLEVTEATFQAEVLDRSVDVPVVLDLWATWCEPCKQLSPILERIADEYAGRFVLATIDVDAEQRIAQALQVQSIPTVLAVIAGQLLPLFTGAVPEDQVRAVLDEVLRVAVSNGVTGTAAPRPVEGSDDEDGTEPEGVEEPEDERFTAAADAIDAGDLAGAIAAYRRILAEEPDNAEAAVALAQTQLLQRVETVDPEAVRVAVAADPEDLESGLLAADLELLGGRVEDAFARLVGLVRSHYGTERDRTRTRLIELFTVVGPDDPRVAAARIALANALY
jgi:putative thioredoxin